MAVLFKVVYTSKIQEHSEYDIESNVYIGNAPAIEICESCAVKALQ